MWVPIIRFGSVRPRRTTDSVPAQVGSDRDFWSELERGVDSARTRGKDKKSPTVSVEGPEDPSASPNATFLFVASEADAVFSCALDGADFRVCPRAKRYTGLKPGRHRLLVRATDSAGNTGPATSYSWTILRSAASPILFASDRDGNYEIYSMNPDGSALQRLTTSPQLERGRHRRREADRRSGDRPQSDLVARRQTDRVRAGTRRPPRDLRDEPKRDRADAADSEPGGRPRPRLVTRRREDARRPHPPEAQASRPRASRDLRLRERTSQPRHDVITPLRARPIQRRSG